MIDSRSNIDPQMVGVAIGSVKKQYHKVDFIIIDNRELKWSIGKCWNEAVKKAKTDWVLFMGDDDWLSRDYCLCLSHFAKEDDRYDCITTGMTFYNPDQVQVETPQQNTGMWKREFLLEHPFNEKLKKGIDREYVEEAQKYGVNAAHLSYHHGIFVRIHDVHALTKRPEIVEEPGDIYINARYGSFIAPVADRLKYQGFSVTVSNNDFNPELARNAKIIWCDWADNNAVEISKFKTDAAKILRVHSYEAFTTTIHYIDFDAFDKVIFVAEHIKDYVETKIRRKLDNAVVIPNGVPLGNYKIKPHERNNKIAWAGNIDRKKGAQLLMFLAEQFREYDFHVAGKFYEEDIVRFFNERKPDNLILEPYSYDLNEFFSDKTYFLNTSPREGCPVTPLEAMASGLKPIMYNWVGAEQYLPKSFIFKDHAEFNAILEGDYTPERYRDYVETRYNFKTMYDSIKGIIDG